MLKCNWTRNGLFLLIPRILRFRITPPSLGISWLKLRRRVATESLNSWPCLEQWTVKKKNTHTHSSLFLYRKLTLLRISSHKIAYPVQSKEDKNHPPSISIRKFPPECSRSIWCLQTTLLSKKEYLVYTHNSFFTNLLFPLTGYGYESVSVACNILHSFKTAIKNPINLRRLKYFFTRRYRIVIK